MSTSVPMPVRAIEAMGVIGIAFWVVTIGRSFVDGATNAVVVLLVGLALGGAHAVVSIGAHRRSVSFIYAIGFIFVGDLLLALFVDPQAFALVAFTIVLGVLAAMPSSRGWVRSAG